MKLLPVPNLIPSRSPHNPDLSFFNSLSTGQPDRRGWHDSVEPRRSFRGLSSGNDDSDDEAEFVDASDTTPPPSSASSKPLLDIYIPPSPTTLSSAGPKPPFRLPELTIQPSSPAAPTPGGNIHPNDRGDFACISRVRSTRATLWCSQIHAQDIRSQILRIDWVFFGTLLSCITRHRVARSRHSGKSCTAITQEGR